MKELMRWALVIGVACWTMVAHGGLVVKMGEPEEAGNGNSDPRHETIWKP